MWLFQSIHLMNHRYTYRCLRYTCRYLIHSFFPPTASLQLLLLPLRWTFDAMLAFQTPLEIPKVSLVLRPILEYHRSGWIFGHFFSAGRPLEGYRALDYRKAVFSAKPYVPRLLTP